MKSLKTEAKKALTNRPTSENKVSTETQKSTVSLVPFELSKLVESKIEEAISMLDVTMDTDDTKLIDQITLGDNWDDPFALTKAMDTQPLYYSRWATLLRKMRKQKQEYVQKFEVWMSIIKEDLTEEIFNENIESGMTANNAKPTNQSVENRFNKYYVSEDGSDEMHSEYLTMKKIVDEIDNKIDTVEIVVKAFEQRKDMLISLGSLVRSMVDNQLLIHKTRK